MTKYKDVSVYQDPAKTDYTSADGWIIRVGHGLSEDPQWRNHFNNTVAASKPLGLYWFLELMDPVAQARQFHNFTAFLAAEQVQLGWWVDSEWGQTSQFVDQFRASVQLPTCGVYGTLSGFNGPMKEYLHFQLNWLALPPGWRLEPGWMMPDHILEQTGQEGSPPVDVDVPRPAQPFPVAWQ